MTGLKLYVFDVTSISRGGALDSRGKYLLLNQYISLYQSFLFDPENPFLAKSYEEKTSRCALGSKR